MVKIRAIRQAVLDNFIDEEGVSPEQAEAALAQWGLLPYYIDAAHEKLAAVILVKGSEIHLVVLPEYRRKLLLRERIRRVLGKLLYRTGFLTTRLPKGNGRDRLFIDRLGFKPTWSDDRFSYFMLTELPFGKDK
jgi:GNAT superfamily N-acetyltransferase